MKVNGELKKLSTKVFLAEFLQREGYAPEKVAVELNGEIIPRREYASTIVTDADKLEIVCFVGGG